VNQQELNHIIQSPSEINAASASELIALCDKYPWFSAPHSLLAHYFARTNDFRKEEWLTLAASRIQSREWLYYFLQPVSSHIHAGISMADALENLAPEPTNVSANSMTELSAMQIPQLELQTQTEEVQDTIPNKTSFTPVDFPAATVPLFQPAEEYDIAKAMGTTFNFEPVDFNHNNQSSEHLDQPKQTRPYNIEEFLSLGLINNIKENIEAPEPIKPAVVKAPEELDFFDWLEIKNSTTTSTSTSNSDRGSIDQQNQGASTSNAAEVNEPLTNLDKFGLINQFIENQPSISRPKQEFYSPERAMKRSETFSPGIVTETLANIFRTQGHFEKAIISYKKLQLKFPEKSAYFASLIEQIKKEQNQ